MKNLPNVDDIVIHRESGSKYVVTDARLEENHRGEKVWKFKVMEVDSQSQRPYLLQQTDIGEINSPCDYFVQPNSSTDDNLVDPSHKKRNEESNESDKV